MIDKAHAQAAQPAQARDKLPLRPGDARLTREQLLRLSLFRDLSPRAQAQLGGLPSQGAVVLRRYAPGELICRQGDAGFTAFFLLTREDLQALGETGVAGSAAAEVLLRPAGAAALAPARDAPTAGLLGLLRRLRRPGAAGPTGASGSDDLGAVVATLGEGEVFGEMSCMHRTPRVATVRAVGDCVALEFLGNILEILLSSERFRESLDAAYRVRALGGLLRQLPLFAGLPDAALELVRQRATLLALQPGDVVFEEGDVADSLYLIRSGTVQVFRRGGPVLAYRSQGEVIGERGLLSGAPRAATCAAYQHPSETARAQHRLALRVELLRIDRALCEELCALAPVLRERLAQAAAPTADVPSVASAPRFSALGLSQGRQLLLVDLSRCTLCGDCVRACADGHEDRQPRLQLEGPRISKYLVAQSCRACADPVCLIGCPVSAIHRGPAGQIVIEDWCIGCGLCAARCPYQAIALHGEDPPVAVTCDQCAGGRHGPLCVRACPHEAALKVDGNEFFTQLRMPHEGQ